jgi:predicted O-methyltransferase YrrM
MLRKMILVIAAVILLLAVVASLMAQPRNRGFRGGPGGRDFGAVHQEPPLPANAEEKRILNVLDDMRRNQSRGMMNVPEADGRLLRLLTEATDAKRVVEIGTSNGYSGIWFCLALRTTGGKLITHDIDEGRAALARQNFKRAGVDKLVTLVMGDAHQTITRIKEPIDIAFIDADKAGYLDYLNKLLPLVRPGGLILAHNMDMVGQDFIKAITTNPSLETSFQGEGQHLAVILKKRQGQ